MNSNVKKFLHRGMLFGGFGPIVVGIVYLVLSATVEGFALSGRDVFVAILSTYLLAFVHAGASVFQQREDWSPAKSMFCHFGLLYLAYVTCYLINTWIPFDWQVILIFTGIFVGTYLVVTLAVVLSIKAWSKKCNAKLG